jgi:hypothetical protein
LLWLKLVRYAQLAIQIEKNLLLPKKLNMKILGIGNAIVDVICKVDDIFIEKNNLNKKYNEIIFRSK